MRYFADIDGDGNVVDTIAIDLPPDATPLMPLGRIEVDPVIWPLVRQRQAIVQQGVFMPVKPIPPAPTPDPLKAIDARLGALEQSVATMQKTLEALPATLAAAKVSP